MNEPKPLFQYRPRAVRFLIGLRVLRQHRIPLNRHNARALWLQSDRRFTIWNGVALEISDDEWDAFMEAIEG